MGRGILQRPREGREHFMIKYGRRLVPRNATPSQSLEAKDIRRDPGAARWLLWQGLRARRCGPKFRRQDVRAGVRLDFYCVTLRLGIVIGTIQEHERITLGKENVRVLVFTQEEILDNPETVLGAIKLEFSC